MAVEKYILKYKHLEDVVFPSKKGMHKYLTDEDEIWRPFLDHMSKNLSAPVVIQRGNAGVQIEKLANAIKTQMSRLDDQRSFNRATAYAHNVAVLPPPSGSLEGQLILGLFDSVMAEEALAAYVFFITKDVGHDNNSNRALGARIETGRILMVAAPIVKALPYSRISTSKMAGSVRAVENHDQSLADEIVTAQKSNAAHEAELQAQLVEQKKQARLINDVVLRLNQKRDRTHKQWM